MKPKAWAQESCDRRDDPVSGARIIQLTSSSLISNNIYCEQPYCSSDGRRVAIVRTADFCFDETMSVLVHELPTLKITMIEKAASRGLFNSAWSGLVYFWNARRELIRLSLDTLESKVVYVEADPDAPLLGASVSPDQRYVIGATYRLTGPGSPTVSVVRLDLQRGKSEVIFEHPEIINPHLQFNPIHGRDILVQHNRGSKLEADGSVSKFVDAKGTTLFLIDANGGNKRDLPVGPPHTAGATGHECFVADTGSVLFSVGWNHKDWSLDARHPTGNIFTAQPGDEKPTVFQAAEHRFNHVCASRCGRYFVADSHDAGALFRRGELQSCAIVVGCLATGKYRTLVADSQASGGGNQCTHAHPYFTADNKHVIYNADPHHGVPQVYAARLPGGFLDSLS